MQVDDPNYEPSALDKSEVLKALVVRHGITKICWDCTPFIILEYEDEPHPLDFCPLTVLGRLAIWSKAYVGYTLGLSLGVLWQRHYPFPMNLPNSTAMGHIWNDLQRHGHLLNSLPITREKKIALFLSHHVHAMQVCLSVTRLLWCWVIEVPERPRNRSLEHLICAAVEAIWGGPLDTICYHSPLPNTDRQELGPELSGQNRIDLQPNQSYLVYNFPDSLWPRRLRCIGTRYIFNHQGSTDDLEETLVGAEEYGVFYTHRPQNLINHFVGWGTGVNRTLLGVPDRLKFSDAEASSAANANYRKPERAMRFLSRSTPPPSTEDIELTDHLFYAQAFGAPWLGGEEHVTEPEASEDKTIQNSYPSPTHLRLSHGYLIPATPPRPHQTSPTVFQTDPE